MQWEHLTAEEFAQAVKDTGVCVIAMGCVEKHGTHLPLGTDFINGHAVCRLAAEKEPAVVFPPFYFAQIYEAQCYPGTVALKPTLLIELIQSVFDEIGRNGFKKIVVYNAHGGNEPMLPFLAQCSLWRRKPYSVYIQKERLDEARQKAWHAVLETKGGGHAGESETSITLANCPEGVKMDKIAPAAVSKSLDRLAHLPRNYSGIWWYAKFPEHYAGDAAPSTVEKGRKLRDLQADSLAEFIANVKTDKVVPSLEDEFFTRMDDVGK